MIKTGRWAQGCCSCESTPTIMFSIPKGINNLVQITPIWIVVYFAVCMFGILVQLLLHVDFCANLSWGWFLMRKMAAIFHKVECESGLSSVWSRVWKELKTQKLSEHVRAVIWEHNTTPGFMRFCWNTAKFDPKHRGAQSIYLKRKQLYWNMHSWSWIKVYEILPEGKSYRNIMLITSTAFHQGVLG